MFSGIIETTAQIQRIEVVQAGSLMRVWIARPPSFNDIHIGDSIAVDGVCLTVEVATPELLQFAIAKETLDVTGWGVAGAGRVEFVWGRHVNLERSLKFGDRIHGHMVAGHVDRSVRVLDVKRDGDMLILKVEIPEDLRPMVWKKGSWAVNGVSLTVNSVEGGVAEHCLIPETLARTNLSGLKVGDFVNVEVDSMARAIAPAVEHMMENLITERAKDLKGMRK